MHEKYGKKRAGPWSPRSAGNRCGWGVSVINRRPTTYVGGSGSKAMHGDGEGEGDLVGKRCPGVHPNWRLQEVPYHCLRFPPFYAMVLSKLLGL